MKTQLWGNLYTCVLLAETTTYATQNRNYQISNMKTYNKEELSGKSLDELHAIADELDIKHAKMNETTLMYEILDKSATMAAAEKVANEKPARKRQRIKPVDHVYSANQLKAKKIEKATMMPSEHSLFGDLSDEDKEILAAPLIVDTPKSDEPEATDGNMEPTEVATVAVSTAEPAPKKRGRSKKAKEDTAAATEKPQQVVAPQDEVPAKEAPVGDTAKKKRGRPKKKVEELPAQEDAIFGIMEDVESDMHVPAVEPLQAEEKRTETIGEELLPDVADSQEQPKVPIGAEDFDDGNDFIILEDIPREDFSENDAPHSIFDKFKQINYEAEEPVLQHDGASADGRWNATPSIINNKVTEQKPAPEPYDFGDLVTVTGVLDLAPDNFGFLRSSDYNYLPSPDDVYVNQSQVKHYGLKTGDVVEGTVRPPREGEKYFPLTSIRKINGCDPSVVRDRVPFEYLTPLFPDEKFRLCSGKGDTPSSRIVDLFSPIGKGQRALIVAQPKTGKTLLMKDIANSIARNHPEAYLMMLLIDERPEEVTDMQRTVSAEVIASTFDAPADNHVKIANLVLEKAKRMVECGHDVVIFLDSITRLARAYNTVSPASGKVLTGGVDANALQKPKRFFGAARNIEGGGSLTIIATALIDTGSKMDEVIFEEFKGTGNMELQPDRSLANKRVYPAVNLVASSTRRDELLQEEMVRKRMWILRKHIADMTTNEAMDAVLGLIQKTDSNEEFLIAMNG